MFEIPINFNFSAEEQQGNQLPSHDQIEKKYTWNLTDIYENDQDWENEFKFVESQLSEYEKFKGTFSLSADHLFTCLKFDENVSIKLHRLSLYSFLSKDLDLSNSHYQSLAGKLQSLSVRFSSECAFIRPEILSIEESKLMSFVNEKEEYKIYKHKFTNMLRVKEHSLPVEQEQIMSLTSDITGAASAAFSLLKNADLEFPSILDENGNEITLSDGRFYAALYSTDRDYRERAYKNYYKPYMAHKNTLASLFTSSIKSYNFVAKVRKYSSTRNMALKANNIPEEIYDNLVETVNNNLAPLHRWTNIRKKVLGLDQLESFDTYVTLFPESKEHYTYDEGVQLCLEALAPLGKEYIDALKLAFDNRWIDVFETKGKRSGAYSSGVSYGCHPYVLLNWNNTLNDVFTLAHEMGHNMHSYFTEKNQAYIYADYPIFLAEVASITNENILLDYLIKKADSKEKKLALLENYVTKIVTTFYRQTAFAEFEHKTHKIVESGESLTPEILCKLYHELNSKYWGEGLKSNVEESYTWSRVPHFYYGFYVYQYATGLAASEMLADNAIKKGQEGVDSIMKFLKSGKSDYAINILKTAGVDMTSPEAINAVIRKMNELLDEIESLI